MKGRQCAGCGAALPAAAPDETVRCPFCGRVSYPIGASRVPDLRPGGMRLPLTGAWLAFLVFALAILIPAALMVYTAVRNTRVVRSAAGTLAGPAIEARVEPAGATALADLSSVRSGNRELDVAPPSMGYARFDAVAAMPWAMAIGQAWSADARLERVDVERVQPDGLVNTQDDGAAEVTYQFVSPNRMEELSSHADPSAEASVVTDLFLRVKSGKAIANGATASATLLRLREEEDLAPADPRVLTLAETFERLGRRREFRAPSYRGYLTSVKGEGWVWYFSTPTGESFARVRATDAQPYPYR
jgi:hypothetical protein